MRVAYVDASMAVKLLRQEPGSGEAVAIWAVTDRVVASRLTRIETCAALAAAHRNHELSDDELERALAVEGTLASQYTLLELDSSVEAIARAVAIRHGLKGADAVHLASALVLEEPELVFATWDRRIHLAAQAEGLAVAPASL